jgi:hypothetical protein
MIPRHVTSGSERTDLLTTVLALDLFYNKARAHALVEYWLASSVAGASKQLPDLVFCANLRTLVLGLRQCALSLTFSDMGPSLPLHYQLFLFPNTYNLAITNAFMLRLLPTCSLKALAHLLNPRGHGYDETPPFRQVVERGAHGHFVISHFAGDRLLTFLCPGPYLIKLMCAKMARFLLAAADPVLFEGGAVLREIGQALVATMHELAAAGAGGPAAVQPTLQECARVFQSQCNRGTRQGLEDLVATLDEMVADAEVLLQGWAGAIIEEFTARAPVPELVRRFDPTWASDQPIPTALRRWLARKAPQTPHSAASTRPQ